MNFSSHLRHSRRHRDSAAALRVRSLIKTHTTWDVYIPHSVLGSARMVAELLSLPGGSQSVDIFDHLHDRCRVYTFRCEGETRPIAKHPEVRVQRRGPWPA